VKTEVRLKSQEELKYKELQAGHDINLKTNIAVPRHREQYRNNKINVL
jgi:hypothetical protein